MAKKKLVVYDDQILIDMDLVFKTIREAKGDWKGVEREIRKLLETMQDMDNDEADD